MIGMEDLQSKVASPTYVILTHGNLVFFLFLKSFSCNAARHIFLLEMPLLSLKPVAMKWCTWYSFRQVYVQCTFHMNDRIQCRTLPKLSYCLYWFVFLQCIQYQCLLKIKMHTYLAVYLILEKARLIRPYDTKSSSNVH